NEVPNSRIEKYFPYVLTLMSANRGLVEIYSAYDKIILLKSNRKNFGISDHPILNLDSFLGRPPSLLEYFLQAKESGSPFYAQEMEYTCHTGQVYYIDLSIVPVHKENNLQYIVCEVSDVTEKVR